MQISTEFLLFGLVNLVVVAMAFATIKTDTRWIKAQLRAGNRRFNAHGRTLSQHKADIAVIKGMCTAHHGTVFPASEAGVSNGDEDGGVAS